MKVLRLSHRFVSVCPGDGVCVRWQAKRDSGQSVRNYHGFLVDVKILPGFEFLHVLEYNYKSAVFGITEDRRRKSAWPSLVPDQISSEPFREKPTEAVLVTRPPSLRIWDMRRSENLRERFLGDQFLRVESLIPPQQISHSRVH